MRKLNNRQSTKNLIVITLFVFVFTAVASTLIYRDLHYARALEISGTVVDINWRTNNHQLPKYVILDDKNIKIEISHFTVALNPSIIKIGDQIVKKEGDDFCFINGEKYRFSRPMKIDF